MRFFWFLTFLLSIFAGLNCFYTLLAATTAPQQSAGFAMSCAFAIVPYVFCRALEQFGQSSSSKAADRIIAAIDRYGIARQEYEKTRTTDRQSPA